jgi:hypothetical protein
MRIGASSEVGLVFMGVWFLGQVITGVMGLAGWRSGVFGLFGRLQAQGVEERLSG